MRQAVRRREYQDDVRDRQTEEVEMVELEKQTEELLQKQMQEMADLEAKQRAAGYLFDDSAHIKVAIGGNTAPTASKQKTNIAFNGDDDDDAGKKRTLIMLDDTEGLTSSQRDERNAEKLRTIRDAIPTDQATLWATKIKWGVAITVSALILHFSLIQSLRTPYLNSRKWRTRLHPLYARPLTQRWASRKKTCPMRSSSISENRLDQECYWRLLSR